MQYFPSIVDMEITSLFFLCQNDTLLTITSLIAINYTPLNIYYKSQIVIHIQSHDNHQLFEDLFHFHVTILGMIINDKKNLLNFHVNLTLFMFTMI